MQYLLDTSICIFFLRGQLKFDEIIREKGIENCYISELTIFELQYGAENSNNPQKSHEAVAQFVNGLTTIPILGSVKNMLKLRFICGKRAHQCTMNSI